MDQVVEAVVRNAMERLIEKQDQRGQPAKDGARKRELARYFEETRRQLVSVLALLRWQQRRLKVTAKCEDLIDALEDHRAHMTMTAERMCVAAEESAHHRTPMYDMRTAVDVLAAGTYCGLPSMEVERTIAPKVEGDEKDAVIAQLDFQLRAELLRMHIPPELSRIEVRDGRLLLEAANEFELELSLRLELPPRPWRCRGGSRRSQKHTSTPMGGGKLGREALGPPHSPPLVFHGRILIFNLLIPGGRSTITSVC